MRKVFILSVVSIILGPVSHAQKITLGIKAGLQNTSFCVREVTEDAKKTSEGSKAGGFFGGIANIQFASKFSIQPSLLLVYKPGSMLIWGNGLKITSIDIPLNLLYNNNGFFVGAGPNFSYGISATSDPVSGGQQRVNLYKKPGINNDPLKKLEIGISGIIGYQFASGLTVNANYTRGLNDISAQNSFGQDARVYTKQFGISIGYMFSRTSNMSRK